MHASILIRCLLILGFLLILPVEARGQSGHITGRIVDSATGETLIGANAVVQGTMIGAATGLDGRFAIRNVPAGTHRLVVTYLGYARNETEVIVRAGETTDVVIRMLPESVRGEEIVVTAQVSGQRAAINQQLASNTITNIVSQDRIRDVPDVNAAESIGRLPGVSIQRSGGEANRVAIRGLSPKYNTVTVNGVRLPATGGDDRSVDLSLISSNMLDGIQVTKALTPDMDADAIGGAIDLRLREAPDRMVVDLQAQGGYNQLQDFYGNYRVAGTISDRFFNGALGIIATGNLDGYDRSADKFSAGYELYTIPGTEDRDILINRMTSREERVDRGRIGASILTDYRIPHGRITGNAFFNRLTNEGVYRVNHLFNSHDGRIHYDMNLLDNATSILTSAAGLTQDFGWLKYDAALSRTASRTDNPQNFSFRFSQEGAATNDSLRREPGMDPRELLPYLTPDSVFAGLNSMDIQSVYRTEDQTGLQANIEVPFRLGRFVNGYVKTGGKLRWLSRVNDETQFGRGGMHYGVGAGSVVVIDLRCAEETMPEALRRGFADAAVENGRLPIYLFNDRYHRPNFLQGDYPLGFTVHPEMIRLLTLGMNGCNPFMENVVASRGRDYTGDERYQAAYFMTELNLGRYATVIGGLRMESDWTRYVGQQFREVVLNNQQAEPTDLQELISERQFTYLLPNVHLRVRPSSWLHVHMARTETLSRPDFIQYVPITRISSMQDYAFAGNTTLRPSHTTGYDVSVSLHQRHVGLLTVSGFHKSMEDHIRWVRMFALGREAPEGLNLPESWLGGNPVIDTYINNPFPAVYRGVEVDWQTDFWYLPAIMQGVVFSVNYTHIRSETQYQSFNRYVDPCLTRINNRCRAGQVVEEIIRDGRMIDQPAHIANVTLGYDWRGFSGRVSYLYQTDRLASVDPVQPVQDQFSGTYSRFDVLVRQKVRPGLEIFTNLNNVTGTADRSFQGGPIGNPTYTEYYGFTMDIGARYRF
jgi:TonB-dependent receptor